MSKIIKVNKSITLKFEDRKINLPNELKENIEKFWKDAVKDNPNLYNGQDYVVEKVNETENKIEMLVVLIICIMKELEFNKKNIDVVHLGEEFYY